MDKFDSSSLGERFTLLPNPDEVDSSRDLPIRWSSERTTGDKEYCICLKIDQSNDLFLSIDRPYLSDKYMRWVVARYDKTVDERAGIIAEKNI